MPRAGRDHSERKMIGGRVAARFTVYFRDSWFVGGLGGRFPKYTVSGGVLAMP